MLLLFDTPAGHALFKVKKEDKLEKVEDIFKHFETAEAANKVVSLKAFKKFKDSKQALAAATAVVGSQLDKGLAKFLKKHIKKEKLKDKLAVADSALGRMIKEELKISCINNNMVNELTRGVRMQLTNLVAGLNEAKMVQMSLSLSHSLARYKLKFSPDKVDTMVVQAIGLLDDLDKEINTYAMRVKEWYGWHFPEMQKIVVDNKQYAQVVLKLGTRTGIKEMDFSDILDEEVEADLKEAALVSMGTEVTDDDLDNIKVLCTQVISLYDYRTQLFDYLKARMNAIAPNLTIMVGELVGARLISHAGSLLNLAKQPASTVQILGAEKALFRALKTKSDTPKYGLIYHASLIGQAAPKNKGKISRVLAAKTALAIRVDALGESSEASIGLEMRAKVEQRLRQLEGGGNLALSGGSKARTGHSAKAAPSTSGAYNPASDSTLAKSKKRPRDEDDDEDAKKKKKKAKKEKKEKKDKKDKTKKKKKKKRDADEDGDTKKKKKKKKKKKAD